MRIVNTDNFNGDYPDERFELYRMSFDAATEVAEVMNRHLGGPDCPRYWKVVEDTYELAPGFEP